MVYYLNSQGEWKVDEANMQKDVGGRSFLLRRPSLLLLLHSTVAQVQTDKDAAQY